MKGELMLEVYWGTFLFGGILILSSIVMGGGDGDADMGQRYVVGQRLSHSIKTSHSTKIWILMSMTLMVMAGILTQWDGSHF